MRVMVTGATGAVGRHGGGQAAVIAQSFAGWPYLRNLRTGGSGAGR
jgi:hypothetical protein